jgi:OFA family oxalate/formate antiporter-like MFS transporter
MFASLFLVAPIWVDAGSLGQHVRLEGEPEPHREREVSHVDENMQIIPSKKKTCPQLYRQYFTVTQDVENLTPQRILLQPLFYVMYITFIFASIGGLAITAQLGPIAKDNKIDKVPVTMLGGTLEALTYALTLDRIFNGISRPISGFVSDFCGREVTLTIAFLIEGVGFLIFKNYLDDPKPFVLITGCVFFAWGEIYSIFPALVTDIFGRKHATTNYGLLYTAKGVSSLVAPIADIMKDAYGTWESVLNMSAAFAFVAAFLCFFVMLPLKLRFIQQIKAKEATETVGLALPLTADERNDSQDMNTFEV